MLLDYHLPNINLPFAMFACKSSIIFSDFSLNIILGEILKKKYWKENNHYIE